MMKSELGRCLLRERLHEAGMELEGLAQLLHYKPERLEDFITNKRVMPLKTAVHISDAIACEVKALYEWVPAQDEKINGEMLNK
ncbi:XRE family transcriptional regulator [Paenibacillus sp. SI8]|uniref:XRE family transcriptional regulator n=1 Tax=unclassified Paenibacillus TaxID=185978 RepID=UPI003467B7D1